MTYLYSDVVRDSSDDVQQLLIEAFGHLEADPRYPVFLEKLGLLEAWKAMPLDRGGVEVLFVATYRLLWTHQL